MKHTSALGKTIDMAALRSKNENVRAVGNMRVNARGDTIDQNDNVVNDSASRVNEQYMRAVAARRQAATPAPAAPPAPVSAPAPVNKSRPVVDDIPEIELPPADIDDDVPNPKKK